MGGFGFEFNGKKAIVFGIANRESIAYAIAKKLNDSGCEIAIGYQERNADAVNELLKDFSKPLATACDVTDDASLDVFFKKVAEEWKTADYLVHSVAFAKREHLRGRFIDVERRGWSVAMEVSAFSLADLLRRTELLMKNGGSCVTLTFMGSEKVFPNYNVMGAAKAALESAIRYAAHDLGKQNIRVNAISASPVPTQASSAIKGFDDLYFEHVHKAPLKRAITKEEIANAALFLLSDLASGITGEVLHVDAGYHIMGM
jgi:enoyl-[acyl-carrier protein] reductase I